MGKRRRVLRKRKDITNKIVFSRGKGKIAEEKFIIIAFSGRERL